MEKPLKKLRHMFLAAKVSRGQHECWINVKRIKALQGCFEHIIIRCTNACSLVKKRNFMLRAWRKTPDSTRVGARWASDVSFRGHSEGRNTMKEQCEMDRIRMAQVLRSITSAILWERIHEKTKDFWESFWEDDRGSLEESCGRILRSIIKDTNG